MATIVMREVTKKVWDGDSRREVIHPTSLEITSGEWMVLRGPSGSGKTTLLGLLGAMLRPTSGEVLFDGEPTSRLRDSHRAEVRRKTVGFVFQDLQLFESMTVLDNVLLPRVPIGVAQDDRKRALALLERFGVAALAPRAARQLSGGERQRVALARALLGDPGLLLLDEPTAHLDDDRAAQILTEVGSIAAEGRAVVTATHDTRVAQLASVTRIVEMHDGHIVSDQRRARAEAKSSDADLVR